MFGKKDSRNAEFWQMKLRQNRIKDKVEFARFALEAGNIEEAKKQLKAAIRIYNGQDDTE